MEKKKIDKILEKIDSGREYRQMTIRVKSEEEEPDKAEEEEPDKDDDKDDEKKS